MKAYVDTNVLVAASIQRTRSTFRLSMAGDYKAVLRSCSNAGLIGGAIFDALHLHSAQKAGCDRLYTFNVRDFRALAPVDFQDKITAP